VRRSSVLLLLLALTLLVGGGLTLGSSSAATRSSRLVICPLAAHALGPINCCGPPIVRAGAVVPPINCCGPPIVRAGAVVPPIDCCPTNAALCPQTLTIDSKPNPSRADRQVVIHGQLLGATTVGVTVELWQQLPGEHQFQQVDTTTTDASGAYTITRAAHHAQTNRQWYVSAGTIRSRTIAQHVEAVVTLTATPAKPGSTIFRGQVSPSHKGERILLERHTLLGWRTFARPHVTLGSKFSHGEVLPNGSVVKAVLPADSRNVRSASASVTVHPR
jgi:hypothetical protein